MNALCRKPALALGAVLCVQAVCAAPKVLVESLGKVPPGAQAGSRLESHDFRRVAQIACTPSGCAVFVNGVSGATFDSIVQRTLRFAGGKHVAYAGQRGDATFLVVEQREIALSGTLAPPSFAMNPAVRGDGAAAMAVLVAGSQRTVRLFDVASGTYKDLGPYDDVVQPQFGADGRPIFMAKRGTEMFVVFDGVEDPHYDIVGLVTLSPDGKRAAYQAHKDGVKRFSVDGDLSEPLGLTSPIVFSPDSKRYGYLTTSPTQPTRFVLDGETSFGPSGSAVSSPFVFSPDSRHVGYAVVDEKDRLAYSIDGVIGTFYARVSDLTFWSNGSKSKSAYSRESTTGKRAIVFTGGVSPSYTPPGEPLALAWSADGRSFSHVASVGSGESAKRIVIVDGKRATPSGYAATGPSAFAASGHQSAHLARSVGGRLALVVDSTRRMAMDAVSLTPVKATADGFAFLVVRDGEQQRIEWRPR